MIIALPTNQEPAQSFIIRLGIIRVLIDIQWNDRTQLFSLSMSNPDTGFFYFQGAPMVLGVDFLGAFNFGIGAMILVDSSATGREAGIPDLGTRVILYWFSEDEK